MYVNENIFHSRNGVVSYNEMGILNIDLNNISLDKNFDEDDPDTIFGLVY